MAFLGRAPTRIGVYLNGNRVSWRQGGARYLYRARIGPLDIQRGPRRVVDRRDIPRDVLVEILRPRHMGERPERQPIDGVVFNMEYSWKTSGHAFGPHEIAIILAGFRSMDNDI